MTLALQFAAVFCVAAIADVFWVRWNQAVTGKRAFSAGAYNTAIVGCGAFMVISYTEHLVLLIAYMLGAFAGTYGAVKWGEG